MTQRTNQNALGQLRLQSILGWQDTSGITNRKALGLRIFVMEVKSPVWMHLPAISTKLAIFKQSYLRFDLKPLSFFVDPSLPYVPFAVPIVVLFGVFPSTVNTVTDWLAIGPTMKELQQPLSSTLRASRPFFRHVDPYISTSRNSIRPARLYPKQVAHPGPSSRIV
jgi:hypothetical protein